VDAKANQITVKTDDERRLNYDPRRLQGVTLYRETERAFAAGDRVQMTAPDRERGVPNRELGTVERIDRSGRMEIRWNSGRTSSFDAGERRHLDYGYAVTSHSSQGQTAGRVRRAIMNVTNPVGTAALGSWEPPRTCMLRRVYFRRR